MKERSILFSGPMVMAIMEGRKTMTRRILKLQDYDGGDSYETKDGILRDILSLCPYGIPGDRLWVRETWAIANAGVDEYNHIDSIEEYPWSIPKEKPKHWDIFYDANMQDVQNHRDDRLIKKWRSSIHMPRWASRLTIEVLNVRVERLGEISIEDIYKEGSPIADEQGAVGWFIELWERINGSWEANPFVWVIEFKRI